MKRHVLGLLACVAAPLLAQQEPDRGYAPAIDAPTYRPGEGPVVCVDEAHHNFHTLDGRFWAFGELLRRDGFVTRPNTEAFTATSLAPCRVLVISNAQLAGDWNDWPYPTTSAFTESEMTAVKTWVERGGSLLLIADHMPLAGAAQKLAAGFGVEFENGFARREPETDDPDIFRRDDHTLQDHIVTRGLKPSERIRSVRTFTGQAFRAPGARPLLVFPAGYVQLKPRVAWEFPPDTPSQSVEGWLQGATRLYGTGRTAFFGEAAMFSAQLAGADREPVGMNSAGAERNYQFVLNVMHWLAVTL